MVWGLKTSVNTGVSAHMKDKTKARVLTTAALGIAFVFCAPGQINKASYTSTINVADITHIDEKMAASETSDTSVKIIGIQAEIPVKQLRSVSTKSEIVSLKTMPKSQKPVQLASLDLNLPDVNKPRDFIPNIPAQPSISPPVKRTTPKLQKKLYGSVELKFDDERKIRAWSSVYERLLIDVQGIKACLGAGCADTLLADWADELRPMQNLPKYQKIEAVNRLVNRRIYADDRRNYGRSDYWASPREFLSKGGDCEDYAILKFASLLALGVSDQDMRVVVGRLSNGTPHAFLATHIGAQEYILDNRQSQIYLTANCTDYVPKYSMNLSYRWSHVMPGATTT